MQSLTRWVVILTTASLAVGCATINPSTTVPSPAGPYAAGENEAVVVFHRRSHDGPRARGDDLRMSERWSYVRVYDAQGTPLADLRATEHTVVRLKPGENSFFVKNWSAEPIVPCVAGAQAGLERGRVYAIDIAGGEVDMNTGCEPLRLVPIERSSLPTFFDELRIARSEQRAFLGDQRETSIILDNHSVTAAVIRVGTERLADSPVVVAADGIAWTAVMFESRSADP